MMHKVRLERYVFATGDADNFAVTLCLQTELPFPPTSAVILGLETESEFCRDEERVKLVMYNVPRGEFYVTLEDIRSTEPEAAALWMIQRGWRVKLFYSESRPVAEEDETVVEVGGKYAAVNRGELFCLRCEGADVRILKSHRSEDLE